MQGSPITAVRGWGTLLSLLWVVTVVISTLPAASATAQIQVVETEAASPAPAVAPMVVPAPGQPAVVGNPNNKPSEGKQGGEPKPGGEGRKPDGAKPDEPGKEKKPDDAPPVRRPAEPKKPANPDELKVRPVDGKVTFSFKGQPWPAVLEWLADISQMSLEWLEAPPGYLDLTTQREYTVAEARDLINSIMMGRGYTLLRNGEVLMVAKLKELDISRVPRVLPSELDRRDENEMVRVLFDLDRLQAEQLVEDLKPLLGAHGKITAMKTTNRIDVLETAGNLRRLRDTIKDEQSASGQDTMLREFQLRHARAEVVIGTLEKLLGLESKKGGSGGGMSPEQMQQQMQQQMMEQQQQMQQQQQGGGQGGPKRKPPEAKIMLAVYQRKNAIYAQATPDKLAIIDQAIKLLDVPASGASSLDQQIARVRTYRLVAADPQVVVNLLKELGNLDPSTQLQIDIGNRIILADAPLADHYTIQELIKKIDGSARRLHVIQLRHMNAESVAGSIELLMRGPKQNDRQQRYNWWDGGGGYGRQNNEQKDSGFQVEADIEANRLLLRANDLERQEIDALLVKLGEDPSRDPRGETMRVLRSSSPREADELLERLQRLSPVPLKIDAPPAATPTPSVGVPAENNEEKSPSNLKPAADRSASVIIHPTTLSHRTPATLAQVAEAELPREQQAEQLPQSDALPLGDSRRQAAVTVTRGPNGLIFTSPDPSALDDVMRLADELSTQDARYHLFPLKHTYAKDMAALFSKIFAGEGAQESDNRRVYYYFDEAPPKDQKELGRLSKRQPLKFIPDPVTNTLLVQGADDRQLTEIRSLIEYYDHLEEPNSESVRQTEFITLKYAKARDVAEVVKEVFRDLLSPNDKSLMQYNQQKAQQEQQNRPLFSYFDSDLLSSKSTDENLPKFKGMISMGVDQRSNSLFISAPGRLLKSIKAMAQRLDDAARPQEPVTRVVRMGGAITDPLVKEALLNFADPAAARRSRERQHNGPNQNSNGQQQNNTGNNKNNGRNGQNNHNGQRNGAHPGSF